MTFKFEKDSAGVLLLCSKKGLKNYFSDKEFDYDFPEGILPLQDAGIIVGVVTESGEEVAGKICDYDPADFQDLSEYPMYSPQKLYLAEADELLVLAHSEFTQICSNHQGDADVFKFWNEKISYEQLPKGWYLLTTYAKVCDEPPYLWLIFQIEMVAEEPILNPSTNFITI
jgi:hypothetical protein